MDAIDEICLKIVVCAYFIVIHNGLSRSLELKVFGI